MMRHAERGDETIDQMVRTYAGHDVVHLRQIARIRAAIGAPPAPGGGAAVRRWRSESSGWGVRGRRAKASASAPSAGRRAECESTTMRGGTSSTSGFPSSAPSAGLVRFAYAEPFTDRRWARYVRRPTAAKSAQPDRQRLLALLARLSHTTNFSVGCYCESEERCHRSILRELLAAHDARAGASPGRSAARPTTTDPVPNFPILAFSRQLALPLATLRGGAPQLLSRALFIDPSAVSFGRTCERKPVRRDGSPPQPSASPGASLSCRRQGRRSRRPARSPARRRRTPRSPMTG